MPQQRALDQLGLGIGNQAQHVEDRRARRRTPSGGNGRAAGSGAPAALQVEREAAGLRFARQELLEQQRLRADRLRPARPRPITRISSRSVSRHDGSRPTMAMPRFAPAAAARRSARRPWPWPRRPCRWRDRCGRSNDGRPPCRTRMQRVAGGLQHADRGERVLALEGAVEGVDEQHHRLAAGGAAAIVASRPRTSMRRRARQKVSRRQRGRRRLRREAEQLLAQRRPRRAAGCAGSAATARGWRPRA